MRAALLAALLLASPAQAAGETVAPGALAVSRDPLDLGRLAFRTFSDEDGLPQNVIEALAFDEKGYLWVATQDGAASYDGRAWTALDMPRRNVSNWIFDLVAARDGTLWFGTYAGGLHHYRNGLFDSFGMPEGLPSNRVLCLAEGPGEPGRTVLYAGTDAGLAAVVKGKVVRFPEVGARAVYALRVEADGTVFAGGKDGLFRRDGDGAFRNIAAGTAIEGRVPRTLARSSLPGGPLYVGTETGLYRVTAASSFEKVDAPPALASALVSDLVSDVDEAGAETLWVGTATGLFRRTRGGWTSFGVHSGLPNPQIRSLAVVRSKGGGTTLWAGTFSGLARLRFGGFTGFGTEH
ncbi:MAG: hypothetical protein JNK60_13435, partial [Acidobacteria bacterium]|nr:hypothetical protein [Acidobacteriota bacterium]